MRVRSLLPFADNCATVAFDLIDKDNSGLIDDQEVETLVKVDVAVALTLILGSQLLVQSVHGPNPSKKLLQQVKQVLSGPVLRE